LHKQSKNCIAALKFFEIDKKINLNKKKTSSKNLFFFATKEVIQKYAFSDEFFIFWFLKEKHK
jgi:hypothetical protein